MPTTESTPVSAPDHTITLPSELPAGAPGAAVFVSPLGVDQSPASSGPVLPFAPEPTATPVLSPTPPFRHAAE